MPVPRGTLPGILTDAAKDGLAGLLEDAALKGLNDAARIAFDLPQFIADDDILAPGAYPTRVLGRELCKAWARGGGPENNPGFDGFWGGLCEPYLAPLDEMPEDGSLGRPFSGGQCDGVIYRVTYSAQSINTDGSLTEPQQRVGFATGPVKGVRGSGSPQFQSIDIIGKNGVEGGISGNCAQGCFANIEVISVVPAFGDSDNCGDPPPEYDPPKIRPGLPPLSPTVPIDIPGIGPVNIGISFNPDGTVNITAPDLGIEVNVDDPFGFGGDGEGDGGGAAGGPPPGDVGDPGASQDTGEGGEAEGEAPEGKVLTGLRVQLTAFPGDRNKYTAEVYRGAYYVYMGVPAC